MELQIGFTVQPSVNNIKFRVIGSSLYLYSVYSMYNNALDECRSKLLKFAFQQRLSAGHWLPLLLGEFSNVLVSVVLVITLFCIFTSLTVPADLILNAVAVNFLGNVDAEFVASTNRKDAVANFNELTQKFIHQGESSDETSCCSR